MMGPTGTDALLLVRPSPQRDLPPGFAYPYEGDRMVAVNDQGRDGDRRRGDGLYSGRVQFDRARFEQDVQRAAQRLESRKTMAPPGRSLRFDRARKVTTVDARTHRASVLQQAREGLVALRNPKGRRSGELFRVNRAGAVAEAHILDRRVPLDLLGSALTDPSDIIPGRSLVITDLQVIADPTRTFDPCQNQGNPDGVWTFKHLVTQIANQSATGVTPLTIARALIELPGAPQQVNGFTVPMRPGLVNSVVGWPKDADGEYILDLFPARLLAIVSRTDLATGGYGGGGGELRFVFGMAEAPCGPAEPSTIILEFRVNKASCASKQGWAQQWLALSDPDLGIGTGSAYNQQLAQMTESVVHAGANPLQSPNRSALGQIRTNDRAYGPWALFEYGLIPTGQPNPGQLRMTTVKQTPDISFKQTPAGAAQLASYIAANEAALLANSHVVPALLPGGAPFLGGEAPTFNNGSFSWTSTLFQTPVNGQALFNFSIATCNGCHTGDTSGTFTHINPRVTGTQSGLSPFMRDPGNPAEDDIERRQRMMADTLNLICPLLPVGAVLPGGFVD
ncbi:hypothetical protein P1X14_15160 [Sphingomonas sp. AOB5]|uniref:hypothetical protein n=1 Tax=Sphingomonas sp. AOB5 TaxID=3034017 RepID=UPI0023F885FC|nr:hypothetical protein [Sphingomonas sp. AOB5]MDF7776594.1 hypothetical protein [Sphingomonas sp. AOB5]